MFFGAKNSPFQRTHFHVVLHTKIFLKTQEACQSESVYKSYATRKLTFLCSGGCRVILNYSWKRG